MALMIEILSGDLGFTVDVDYSGNTHAQADRLLAEGDDTPAEVFFGQDAAALGMLDQREMLEKLPDDILGMVPARYRSNDGTWIATSARERVLVYNTVQATATQLPAGIDGLLDPAGEAGSRTPRPTRRSSHSSRLCGLPEATKRLAVGSPISWPTTRFLSRTTVLWCKQ